MRPSHRRMRRTSTALCLSILGIGVLGGCEKWSVSRIEESKRRAEPIVTALEAYLANHGAFPERLDALVPRYMQSIPDPTAGSRKWHYSVRDNCFSLSFGCGADQYPNCTLSWTADGMWWILDE